MDTLFDMQKQHVHYGIIPASWPAAQFRVVGAGPSVQQMHAGSMEPLPPAHTPVYEHKRHRLTQLLDKLAVHITNNNHYPTPAWLVQEERPKEERSKEERPKEERPKEDDLPLDLSVKADRGQPEVFACTACGETFSVHDRLTKHVASRHRNKVDNVRSYECPQCCRKFARSDMLTRHARLHTGVKPYACRACGQVFSRSDHLATHQRTHTGEKPYRCPSCPYAACRRDMITRHMRTHMRRAQPV